MNLNQAGVYKVIGYAEYGGVEESMEEERTVSALNASRAIALAEGDIVGAAFVDEPETGEPVKRTCKKFVAHTVEFVTNVDVVGD